MAGPTQGGQMRFKLGCELAYEVKAETPFVFNIEVQETKFQSIIYEQTTLDPDWEIERWDMAESGNRYFRTIVPPGEIKVRYEAEVETTPSLEDPAWVAELPISKLPLSVFPHLYPSRYCQSDKLERFARSTFGGLQPGYARVNGICNWIYEYVQYQGGTSDALTSAFDTVTQRAGVCRDFAHLAIALCRTLGIPARYVSAYALGLNPPDFHAVFEAFLAGAEGRGWYIFDATRKADPAGLVRIGVGRDAADAAFCSPFGSIGFYPPKVWIEAVEPTAFWSIQAVRTD